MRICNQGERPGAETRRRIRGQGGTPCLYGRGSIGGHRAPAGKVWEKRNERIEQRLGFVLMPFRPLSSSIASARHDQVEKFVRPFRIEASQFLDDFQGGCPVAGQEVRDPEVAPDGG